ncbi:Glucose-1-phosphate thymidylyltransferase [hydrothermal vent metagenome]|uniref:Glucose-1-phosphate thymidylyltransferase n=1 Tax=hydrothermal vent metagenome TaxID=652676 RepID=A0A1W1BEI3_9ZZZZ
MKGMILAAGRGSRMMPLTKNTPKPLLKINNETLIEKRIKAFKKANITDIIINIAYLGEQIKDYLKNGKKFGVNITYSEEKEGGLETAGGIIKVLDFFEKKPFIVSNSDILCDYSLNNLTLKKKSLAHLVLVNNPKHNPQGDFGIENSFATLEKEFTFSGIACYHPELFKNIEVNKKIPLSIILKNNIIQQKITAEHYQGSWEDIGTPERLNKNQ